MIYALYFICCISLIVRINTCGRLSYCLPFQPLLLDDLVRTWLNLREDFYSQMMSLVCYAHFPLKKFMSLSITHWSHSIMFFSTFFDSTQSFHGFLLLQQCGIWIATFVRKVFKHLETLLSFTCIMWEHYIFWSDRSYSSFEYDDNIFISTYLFKWLQNFVENVCIGCLVINK